MPPTPPFREHVLEEIFVMRLRGARWLQNCGRVDPRVPFWTARVRFDVILGTKMESQSGSKSYFLCNLRFYRNRAPVQAGARSSKGWTAQFPSKIEEKSYKKQDCSQDTTFFHFWCYTMRPGGAKELQKLAQELQSGAREGPKIDKKSKKIERWIPGGCPEHSRGRKNQIFHKFGEF